jgi:hypothetical protein
MFATEDAFNSVKSPSINPSYPLYIPTTSMWLYAAVLTTALIAAFMPGESPPDVNTPIFFISFNLNCELKIKVTDYRLQIVKGYKIHHLVAYLLFSKKHVEFDG